MELKKPVLSINRASGHAILALTLLSLQTIQGATEPYSSRPHPETYLEQAAVAVSAERLPQLRSMLNFILELRLLYPEKVRTYLARDSEPLYEMDWFIWKLHDEEQGPEPTLINVSSKTIRSKHLFKYLRDVGTLTETPGEKILVDTGFEGTIVNAINKVLKKNGYPKLPAHLISSTHPDSPSSRVYTEAEFAKEEPLADSLVRETFLDGVDRQIEEIEGILHFTNTATAYRFNKATERYDAYSPQAEEEQIEQAIQLSKELKSFILQRRQRERIQTVMETLSPAVAALKAGEPESISLDEVLHFTRTKGFALFWWDLREAFGRGVFEAPAEAMTAFWKKFPGGMPPLFDLQRDQLKAFKRREAKRLKEKATPPKAPKIKSPKEKQLSDLKAEAAKTKQGKAQSGFFEISDISKRMPIEQIIAFHKAKKAEPKKEKEERLRELRNKIEHEGRVTIEGKEYRIRGKIGEGVRAEVFLLEGTQVLKVPYEADDLRYIAVEYAVERYLQKHQNEYGIGTIHTSLADPEGYFLLRPRFASKKLGESIAKQEEGLPSDKMDSLRLLYEAGKKFANETGIGLDLKYDNLAWDQEWILFDVGPRTSFGPYAFSLDIDSFETFYRLWKIDEPRTNGLKISSLVKRKKQSWANANCAEKLAQ